MKRIIVSVVGFALAVSMFAGASISDAEEPSLLEGCAANVVCVYKKTNYNEAYKDLFCEGSGVVQSGVNLTSATNRCGNKTDWLRLNGSVVACMNPGGNRPSPGLYNEVFLAAEYGSFC